MTWIGWSLLIVTIAFLALWVIVAILLRRSATRTAPAKLLPIELEDMEDAIRDKVADVEALFADLGFIPLRRAAFSAAKNLYATCTLLTHPDNQVRALIMTGQGEVLGGEGTIVYSGFISEFADGTAISTSNAPALPILPTMPSRQVIRLPAIHDIPTLHAAHRKNLTDRRSRVPLSSVPLQRDHLAFLCQWIAEDDEYVQRIGYYRLDPSGRELRLTWKGACIGALRLLFLTPLHAARARRRAKRLVAAMKRGSAQQAPAGHQSH